ncbi:uncharacterized protein LOC124287043 [Haliotis rubra]|uniref:uncharacterized protein LOC124287043 n=1 Tax=Haliotis rubra TaxID=36100 RepID=UPI001EE5AED8|nr:uncharacterized protein LOC124287043 [Haliotis rubra]
MEAQTFMLWFQLDQERLADHEIEILSRVKALPGLFWTGTWTTATEQQLDNGGFLYITVNSDGSHAVMRLFPSGFLTLDLQRLAATQLPDKPQGSSVITHSAIQNLQNNLDTKKGTLDIPGVEKEFLVSGSRSELQKLEIKIRLSL